MPLTTLSNATLGSLRSDVLRPAYDRSAVTPGIVHLGVGAFHRAHQAVFADDALGRGESGWGIVAASLRSPGTRDALAPQDGLYSLALRDGEREEVRVIGSIGSILVAPEAPARLVDALADPRVKLVTLTVTEKGYLMDLAAGALLADHADVRHDLANPAAPRSAIGFLVEAIARRRAAGIAPFTIVSCDNLPSNGATLSAALSAFAEARDPALARFIAEAVACPSSMVDRIVPATTDADRAAIDARLGVADAWPVVGEPYFQWVIEDRFSSERPRFEESGVEFVADVRPFEHMKLRLLNGSHTVIAAAGRLAGFETVARAFSEPTVRRLVDAYWRDVIPTIETGEAAATAYTGRLKARYANSALAHRTAQIATDASLKVPQRLLAPLREQLAAGAPAKALTFAVALWIRSCGGIDDAGRPFEVTDPALAEWSGRPDQSTTSPEAVVDAFLGFARVFGSDLPARPGFRAALTEAYAAIRAKGVLAAVEETLLA